MGRLIDADVVEKALREYADDVGCKRGEYELANGILKAVGYIRHNIQTAYDVEKVVAEFEQKIEFYRLMEIETLHKGMASNTRMYTSNRFCFENALEIVKRGDRE